MPFPAYRPMSCDDYSRLELAIMHKSPLRMRWKSREIVCIGRILPRDLRTRCGAEYLLFEDHLGRRRCMRLDRILAFDTMN
jgi:Rho-binding antiterminator